MKVIRFFLLSMAAVLLAACEKPLLTEQTESGKTSDGNLRVSISQLEQTPFSALTRAAVSDVCTKLNFAIYDMTGARLKQINQKVGDADFGTATFQLTEGDYQLVVLAHSSNSNPTMTNVRKIQFTNALGYTDTFLYYTTLTIDSEQQDLSVSLDRIVALCRFVISDAIPENVSKLQFQYTGGSGHFDATTGLGVTNSTQKVTLDVQPGQEDTQCNLYTFLHDTTGTIHLKVTAYDANENIQHEREFDVPMTQNKITWLTGNFFNGVSPSMSQTVVASVIINSLWDGEEHVTY